MNVNMESAGSAGARPGWRARWWGMFNLNDPRWGRGDDSPRGDGGDKDDSQRGQRPQGPNQGPPDLDELWRDFNRKLGGLLGGKGGGNRGGGPHHRHYHQDQ